MKADAEWDSLNNKVAGSEVGWERVAVVPVIATVPLTAEHEALCNEVKSCMLDLSSQIPSTVQSSPGELVIGTLDLNIGVNLPAEELVGSKPEVCICQMCCRV